MARKFTEQEKKEMLEKHENLEPEKLANSILAKISKFQRLNRVFYKKEIKFNQ